MGKIIIIGLALIFFGILLVFAGGLFGNVAKNANINAAGGIFIGPIPIFGFASDRKMLYVLFAIGILLFVISYFISRNF